MTRMERRKWRRRQKRRRAAMLLAAAVITTAAVTAAVTSIGADEENAQPPTEPTLGMQLEEAVKPIPLVYEVPTNQVVETTPKVPDEAVETEPTLEELNLHEEIPLDYDLQRHLMDVCDEYGVPYHIALAVIQAESSFTENASNGDCYGYMQINSFNADWLASAIGVTELTDPYQNLRAGIFILGGLFDDYGDWHKALIAYNYGPAGAQEHVFSKGYTTTQYSRTVMSYAEEWLEVVGE